MWLMSMWSYIHHMIDILITQKEKRKNSNYSRLFSRCFKNIEISIAPAIRIHRAFFILAFSFPLSRARMLFAKLLASRTRSSTRKILDRKWGACAISTFCTSRISRCFNIPLTQRWVVSARVFALKILKRRARGRRKINRKCAHSQTYRYVCIYVQKRMASEKSEIVHQWHKARPNSS